jgi:OOP family OmpA-OmpF porin
MRSILIFLFLFSEIFMSAQNLVVNPDFEDCGKPWKNLGVKGLFVGMDIPGWTDPSGTSDYYYFTTEKKRMALGDAYPQQDSGVAYGGFILTENGGEEYIEGTLTEPLIKGKTYRFSVSIYDTTISNYIPLIGIYFSYRKQSKLADFGHPISLTPQIKLDPAKYIDGQYGWHTYYQDYTANGDENYFIIGVFKKENVSDYSQNSQFGYCDIDNVSLVPQESATDSAAVEIATEPIIPERPDLIDDSLIAPGKTFVTQNIFFDTDKSILKNESYPTLFQVLSALKEQPDMKVEIDGHTDNVGNVVANQKLSEARAKAVADFFIRNGIDASRITWKGFGSSKPISNDNDKNRRVEFIFSE